MKKLERPGKCSIQLKSAHFELLINSNVNYLSFEVRQTDLFLSHHVSISISYGSCVPFNILISKTVVGRIRWYNVFKHLVHHLHQNILFPAPSISPRIISLPFVLCCPALWPLILQYLSGLLSWIIRTLGSWAVLMKVVLKFSYLYFFNAWNCICYTLTLLRWQFWANFRFLHIIQWARISTLKWLHLLPGWWQFLFVLWIVYCICPSNFITSEKQ